MSWIYSPGVNPVSTTLSSSPSAGGTSFTITSATGLPTIPTGSFGTARIQAEGANTAEDIIYTRSGTTITLANSTTLASAHASTAAIDFDVISSAALDMLRDAVISGHPENALTGAGALVKGAGKANRITITSAAATFTLADGTFKGEVCRIVMDRSCTKLATVDPAGSTTIDGLTTRIMWAGEIASLAWNGTEWNKVGGRSIPMIGSMYLSADTASTVENVLTQVALNTSLVDNTGLMVNTGSNKITVQRPGNYVARGMVAYFGGSAASPYDECNVKQGATVLMSMLQSRGASGGCSSPNGVVSFVGAVADDIILSYRQHSGQTTPIVLGGRQFTALEVTELVSW